MTRKASYEELQERIERLEKELTERRQVEKAFLMGQRAIECSISAIAFAEFGGNLTYVNEAFLELWGYESDEEVLGRPAVDFWRMPAKAAAVVQAFRDRGSWIGELVAKRKDGAFFDAQVSATLVTDAAGKPSHMMGSFLDITARKQGEEALRQNEEKLNAMLGSIGDHMSMIDEELNIIWANSQVEKSYGPDIIGKKCYEVFHGRKKPCEPYPCITLKAFEDGKVHQSETRVIDRDGKESYFNRTANVALRDRTGRPMAVIEVATDITELKHAGEALRESEEKYRSLVEHANDGIAIIQDGVLKYANPRLAAMGGYSVRELVDKPFTHYIHPDEIVEAEDYYRKRMRGEEVAANYERRLLRKNGNVVHCEITGGVITYQNRPADLVIVRDVTARKQVEQAVRESEEKFRLAFEHAADAIFWADGETGFITQCNKAAEILLEKSREEIVGKHQRTLHPPEQAKYYAEMFTRHMRQKGAVDEDAQVLTKSGRLVPVHITASVTSVWGKPIIQGIFRDITYRERAERVLRESEARYRAIVEDQTELICRFLPDGTLTFVNEAYCRYFGKDQKELIGHNFMPLIPDEDRSKVSKNLASLSPENAVVTHEHRVIGQGGGIRWQQWTNRMLLDEQGRVIEFQAVGRDITDRKLMEEALRESEEKANVLLNASEDVIALTDVEGVMAGVNDAMARRFGKRPEEMIGLNIFDLFPPDVAKFKRSKCDELVRTGKPVRFMDENFGAWFDSVVYPIFDSKGKVKKLATFGRDITLLKKAQDELLIARDELERRVEERTAELREANEQLRREIRERKWAEDELFIYHEKLRSLTSELALAEERERRRIAVEVHDHIAQNLAFAKINLGAIRESISSDEARKTVGEVIKLIDETIQDARSLISELASPVLYELGFVPAVEWLTQETQKRHGIALAFEDDGEPKPLSHELRVLLFQAVRELLVNVAKHAQARNGRVRVAREGGQIRVDVEDDGVGFDVTKMVPSAQGGNGFGFFSIQQRLQPLGGFVNVQSKRGHGTRVTLLAPMKYENETPRTTGL